MSKSSKISPFESMGLPKNPVLLAPLAGVTDHPFRRVCTSKGADLTYVEMISATALLYESPRTYRMLKRHESEEVLGIQITGKTAEDVGKAVGVLDKMNFDTIDINMGCPVKKVVKTGCGSAILRDPERVYQTVKLARENTDKPLSAKIRIGWDHDTINGLEVTEAIVKGGADFMTVHGRTRNDDYSKPVDLEYIKKIKEASTIPVIGNGNIFSSADSKYMTEATGVDGVMVSRGALGNPWIFHDIKTGERQLDRDEWVSTVADHLRWQQEEYGDKGAAAICMRKHLLWYAKGWPGVKVLRERMNTTDSLAAALDLIYEFEAALKEREVSHRFDSTLTEFGSRFVWDPKFEMDRKLDRGVGDDHMEATL